VSLLLLAVMPAAAAPAKSTPKRPSELAPSPSDRALHQDAQQALTKLRASRKLQAKRGEWDKVVAKLRKLVLKYPQSQFCDDALLATGDLLREMSARFKTPRHADEALAAYRRLADDYPRSKLGEPALYAVFEMASESGDKKRVSEAARGYLETYPDGKHSAEVKKAVKKPAARAAAGAPEPALPTPPPPGVGQVFSLRSWSGESSTRVVLDVEKELPIKWDRLTNPDRLFVDLRGARLHPSLKDRQFPVGDGLLEQVRIGQNQEAVVRVVLDFKSVQDQQIFYLRDPMRLVIDVHGARQAPGRSRPAAAEPAQTVRVADEQPVPEETAEGITGTRRISGMAAPDAKPAPPAGRAAGTSVVLEGTPAAERKTAARSSPNPPAANRSGQYSLARQLGLSARRIVIDAGHGGHDPGTIGRAGLQEKDLVLDVALRLEKLLREQLGAEVVMTRASDVFIPLEERTAIANAKGADLFLSVHANSSPNPRARGVETYFLNFAKNEHAEEVAARENAISEATLKDLQNLVKAIALNSKIDESRDFASEVQEALVESLRGFDPSLPDRGVHTAPFYVLIGANMPSILAEIAFVSHPGEEKLLKTRDYRETIAKSLFHGVARYFEALNRTASRPLTGGGSRTRVAGKSTR
jgi:N-acetylmuramoyl-L-alanine amidase